MLDQCYFDVSKNGIILFPQVNVVVTITKASRQEEDTNMRSFSKLFYNSPLWLFYAQIMWRVTLTRIEIFNSLPTLRKSLAHFVSHGVDMYMGNDFFGFWSHIRKMDRKSRKNTHTYSDNDEDVFFNQ